MKPRIPSRIPSLLASLTACTLAFGAMTARGQDNPVPPAPPGKVVPKAGENETPLPSKNGAEKKKPTPTVSEHVPPVKVGMELETTPDGVLVKQVAPGSAADEAGLETGDRIIRIAGSQVLTPIAVDRRFHKYRAGSKLEIVALRKGREVKATLLLPKTHEPIFLDQPEEAPTKVTVINTDPAVPVAPAYAVGWVLQERDGKVWISDVTEGTIAAAAGLRRGDVIVRADRTAVNSAQALTEYLSGLDPNQRVAIEIERGTKVAAVEFVMPAQRTTAIKTGVVGADVYNELLARQKVQEELLVKVLAEVQALRAELKARP
jgi:predicted metalloprotease with PDZ domain